MVLLVSTLELVIYFLDVRSLKNLLETSVRLNEVCCSDKVWMLKIALRWRNLSIVKQNPSNERVLISPKQSYFSISKQEGEIIKILQNIRNFPQMRRHFIQKAMQISPSERGLQLLHFLQSLYTCNPSRIRIDNALLYEGFQNINELLNKPFSDSITNDLGLQYYASKLFVLRNALHWRKEAELLRNSPVRLQNLEDGFLILSWWNDLSFSPNSVRLKFREYRDAVWDRLLIARNCDNSFDERSAKFFVECMEPIQVIEVVKEVLYNLHNFRGNIEDYYNPSNSFLHSVLRTGKGIPLTLSVVFAVTCHSVGLHCIQCVGMPGHFLLSCQSNSTDSNSLFYIDAFDKGKVITKQNCYDMMRIFGVSDPENPAYLKSITNVEVWTRCLRNLLGIYQSRIKNPEKHFGLLSVMLGFDSMQPEIIAAHAQVAKELGFYDTALQDLNTLASSLSEQPLVPFHYPILNLIKQDIHSAAFQEEHSQDEIKIKRRQLLNYPIRKNNGGASIDQVPDFPGEILYRIGQVITHRKYGYAGLIIGWDTCCNQSEEWQKQMGVSKLVLGPKQPFYNVLVDARDRPGEQETYVAQENIIPGYRTREDNEEKNETGGFVHSEIGKYFDKKISNIFYFPSAICQKMYPDDLLPDDKSLMSV